MIDEYVKKWLIKGLNDFKSAQHEMRFEDKKEIITEAVCFHCQQAVEKFIKAYLILNNIEFGKIHNLEFLLQLCSQADKDFSNLDVGDLSFYAVEVRYPDDFYIPSYEEANRCLELANKAKNFIFPKLSIDDESIIYKEVREIVENNDNCNSAVNP